jgi:rare lipoprotein A
MSAFVSPAVISVIGVFAAVAISTSTSQAKSHERATGHGKAMHHPDRRNVEHRAAGSRGGRPQSRQSSVDPGARDEPSHESGHNFTGMASYYAESQHVASGAKFDPSGYTCAHPTLPFGTHLRVADPKSGRSVVVTVNDRGPFVRGRALDLSLGAARALGMVGRGVMRVEARVI